MPNKKCFIEIMLFQPLVMHSDTQQPVTYFRCKPIPQLFCEHKVLDRKIPVAIYSSPIWASLVRLGSSSQCFFCKKLPQFLHLIDWVMQQSDYCLCSSPLSSQLSLFHHMEMALPLVDLKYNKIRKTTIRVFTHVISCHIFQPKQKRKFAYE